MRRAGRSRNLQSISGRDSRFVFFPQRPDRRQSPSSVVCNCYRGTDGPAVKRLRCEADKSPPSIAEGKFGRYTSVPQYALMAWCLSNGALGKMLPYLFTYVLVKAKIILVYPFRGQIICFVTEFMLICHQGDISFICNFTFMVLAGSLASHHES
jgi:hypothetical protein